MIEEGPTWDEGVTMPKLGALSASLDVDVAIIGGGITGLTTAYLLSSTGRRVAVLEKGTMGFGATGVTTAFVTQIIDTSLADLPKMFGEEAAKLIVASHREAIDILERIILTEHIECEFTRCTNFMYANSAAEYRDLEKEVEAARALNVAFHLKRDDKLGFSNAGYAELDRQAKFHPLKYLSTLLRILQERGVMLFDDTEVKDIRAGTPAVLVTPHARVTAQHVVMATYAPIDGKLFFKKAFYDSYVLEASVSPGVIAEGIYEDLRDPYHYLRVDRRGERDRIILGGEDHRADLPVNDEKCFQALEEYFHEKFSKHDGTIVRRWQGPILESIDGLAWIGRHKEPNIYYATGFSGNGMTYSMIAAKIFSDMIQGTANPWERIYNPRRWPTLRQLMHKGRDYTRELFGGAVRNTFRRKH